MISLKIIVGITGASGAIYGISLIKALHKLGIETHLIVSGAGETIIQYELGVDKRVIQKYVKASYDIDDLSALPASGSFYVDAMVIAPCSMNTLGKIAGGIADNLLTRAASNILKENGNLVLVPRETPLSAIHLENMLRLARAGASIVPASPAFYHKPEQISDLVNFIVGKTLDILGVENSLFEHWKKDRTKNHI